eukprot:1179183-Prorocentrum_minimum.AAC.5
MLTCPSFATLLLPLSPASPVASTSHRLDSICCARVLQAESPPTMLSALWTVRFGVTRRDPTDGARCRGGKALLPFFKTLMNKAHVTVIANENVRLKAEKQRLSWAERVEVFPSNLPQVWANETRDQWINRARELARPGGKNGTNSDGKFGLPLGTRRRNLPAKPEYSLNWGVYSPPEAYTLSTAGGVYSPREAYTPSTAGGVYSPREAYTLSTAGGVYSPREAYTLSTAGGVYSPPEACTLYVG